VGNFMICTPSDDNIKNNEMGGACCTKGGGVRRSAYEVVVGET
jgi:hypothetical protein